MLKRFVLKCISMFVRAKLSRSATIPRCAVISRFSEIRLEDGSKLGDVYLGKNVMLHGRLVSQHGGFIRIHDNVNIRSGTLIGSVDGVEIHDGVVISNDVVIMDNNNHPVSPEARRRMVASGWSTDEWLWKHSTSKKIVIEENVWIGQHSRINKGVTVGMNSIVAACSVVTKNVPPNSIVAGNPARVVKSIV